MLGNFTYHNPTKLIFGKDAMEALATELAAYGPTVQLVYGGGSIKKNGIYDQVISALAAAGKTVVEDAGVMPNPTVVRARALSRLRHAVHDARVRRPAARLRAGALAVELYQHLRSIMPWTEHGSSTEGFRQTGEEGKKRE